jgi:uncharacterized protein YbbK (DUF523 family)
MACDPKSRVPVGISSCLLGQPVRYDGGHKRDPNLVDVLGKYFDYVPFCPEVAIGLGTPRPPIQLTGNPSRPRAVTVDAEDLDVTGKLDDYAHSVMANGPRISGYIFKSGSPSCGMQGVTVYDDEGTPGGTSPGLYARVVMRSLPLLPVEGEDRLTDTVLRDCFVERVFVYDRWQRLCDEDVTPSSLADFHNRHARVLRLRAKTCYDRLGHLIAEARTRDMEVLSYEYIETLMEGLERHPARG